MKLLLLGALFFISIYAHAQTATYVFAGVQGSNAKYTINGSKQDVSFKIGGQAGIGMKIPFEGRLSFVPQLFYSLKGYKVEYNQSSPLPDPAAVDNNTTIHCVELAALLQHDFTKTPEHFFFRIGPSLDFQLFGNEEFNTNTNTTVDRPMPFSFSDYGNYSGNLLAHFGYEAMNRYFVYAQYSFGLASINNYDGGPQIRHRCVGVSFGLYLNRKK